MQQENRTDSLPILGLEFDASHGQEVGMSDKKNQQTKNPQQDGSGNNSEKSLTCGSGPSNEVSSDPAPHSQLSSDAGRTSIQNHSSTFANGLGTASSSSNDLSANNGLKGRQSAGGNHKQSTQQILKGRWTTVPQAKLPPSALITNSATKRKVEEACEKAPTTQEFNQLLNQTRALLSAIEQKGLVMEEVPEGRAWRGKASGRRT